MNQAKGILILSPTWEALLENSLYTGPPHAETWKPGTHTIMQKGRVETMQDKGTSHHHALSLL